MSAADDPKTQVQTSPSSPQTQVATDPIAVSTAPPSAAPVKVTKPRMSPEAFNKITARLDAALVALVLVFAFVTACFAVRNSDFFQYLAIGRLIAHGEYHIGKDPFSFATDSVRWVDHSWLTSYVLYLIYNFGAAGAVAIIVLKGVAIAALACILLLLSRNPGQPWLIPASCTAVAILALSARVLMQPVVVSYFFLGLTMLVLRWPYLWPETKTATPRSYRCYWLLAPLFALWVNCDQWFFLGPVTAGLYWLGEYLQDTLATDRTQTRPAGELRTLGYAVLAGAAACLLNPQHVYALTLPPQLGLSAAATAASKDKQLEALFVSPLDKGYWVPSVGLSAAGIAYFPLLLAGIASFVLSYNTLRYWRVFLFLAFGVLSVYHARAIPFFAVIAGPITSLNFLDYVASRFGGEIEPDRLRDRWAIGRAVALLAAVALVVCSVPGWTQTQPYASRHLGWSVVPDESLVRTCTKMAEWRRDGLVKPEARWFNTSPDVLNYMSWYCPGERGFLDLRLALFDATAADYVRVREELLALNPPPDTDRNQPPVEEWPAVFKKENVDYVIIHYPYAPFLFHPLQRLYRDPAWTPLSLDGHTLVFAWNKDAEAFQRNQRMQFDLNPAAFGPNALPAPRNSAGRAAVKHEWYAALWEPAPPPRAQEVDDARLYLGYNELQNERWELENRFAYGNFLRKCGSLGGMPSVRLLGNLQSPFYQMYSYRRDPQPPAALYVALRGLRRSLRDNPDDAQAYLALGQIYMALFWDTQERQRTSIQNYHQVAQIRQTQITWALNKALQLDPDLVEAHALLAQWYKRCRDRNLNVACYIDGNFATPFIDSELRHRKEQLRLLQHNIGNLKLPEGSTNADGLSAVEAQLKQMEQEVQNLDTDVKKRFDQYTIHSAGKNVIQRAQEALNDGLGDEALAVLRGAGKEDLVVRQSNGRDYPVGAIIEIKLLLAMGEVETVREILESNPLDSWGGLPDLRALGYDWFRLLVAAALGDYDDADDALKVISEFAAKDELTRLNWLQQCTIGRPDGKTFTLDNRSVVALVFGQTLLNEAAKMAMPWQITRYLTLPLQSPHEVFLLNAASELLSLEADYPALRGWMCLEAGDTIAARKHFNTALLAALPHDRKLALSAATGLTSAAQRPLGEEGPLWAQNDFVPLHSIPLAKMGLFFLDHAEATKR